MHLRVIEAFADHAIGDTITDAEEVAAILESHAVAFVVKFLPAEVPAAAEEDPAADA